MSKSRGRVNGFIRLERDLVQSERWRALSPGARCLFLEIWARHDGRNNGAIPFSNREAVATLRCHPKTAVNWFGELQDAGFLIATERGSFAWKAGAGAGRATRWQVTTEPLSSNEAAAAG